VFRRPRLRLLAGQRLASPAGVRTGYRRDADGRARVPTRTRRSHRVAGRRATPTERTS